MEGENDMRSVAIKQVLMMIMGFVTAVSYFILGEHLFGIVLCVFSSVFLLGIFERRNLSFSYKVAHLYVGSILMLIAASYLIVSLLLSYFNLLVGESPMNMSIPDFLLVGMGILALFNLISLRKAVVREKTP